MLDPTHTIGLQSLDFGSVYSSDGREHPLLALTPVFRQDSSQLATSQPTSTSGTDPASTALGVVSGALPSPGSIASSFLPSLPPHFGARVAVGVIAIAILLIVVARLILVK
jgi:hypothetical protein